MRGRNRQQILAGLAVAAALATAWVGVGAAAPTGAGSPTDTTPAPEPQPDPAPPVPKRTPKPAPKASPAPRPAPVYHAPVAPAPASVTPAPARTAPVRVTPRATPKVVHHRKHKRHKRARHLTPKPKPKPTPTPTRTPTAQVKHASVVRIAGVPAAAATDPTDAIRRGLVIGGLGLAGLIFLLVVSVPASALRFTPAGRAVMDHQTDLVLTGVGLLLATALLFAVTGTGS